MTYVNPPISHVRLLLFMGLHAFQSKLWRINHVYSNEECCVSLHTGKIKTKQNTRTDIRFYYMKLFLTSTWDCVCGWNTLCYLYQCITHVHTLSKAWTHKKRDHRAKRSKIQTLRMLFMENTFLPLVLIFSAGSAEWPADETLPRHKQHETHHKTNHFNTSEQFFLITQHARSNMTQICGIYFTFKLESWLVERSVCHIQKPANDISLQSVEPVDLFFSCG